MRKKIRIVSIECFRREPINPSDSHERTTHELLFDSIGRQHMQTWPQYHYEVIPSEPNKVTNNKYIYIHFGCFKIASIWFVIIYADGFNELQLLCNDCTTLKAFFYLIGPIIYATLLRICFVQHAQLRWKSISFSLVVVVFLFFLFSPQVDMASISFHSCTAFGTESGSNKN